MKFFLSVHLLLLSQPALCQQLQLHYDLRHTLDPANTRKNYLTLYFEYFKVPDSGNTLIKPGSFLLKIQSDFNGEKNNAGQLYIQVSQAFRFWQPKIFLQLQYGGGLGIAEPGAYGYYLSNAYSLGVAYPFQWKSKAFFNAYTSFQYKAFKKTSHDVIGAFFWIFFWKNFRHSFSGNLVGWTENRNRGNAFTAGQKGKKFAFFGDPQIWFGLYKGFSADSRISLHLSHTYQR